MTSTGPAPGAAAFPLPGHDRAVETVQVPAAADSMSLPLLVAALIMPQPVVVTPVMAVPGAPIGTLPADYPAEPPAIS